MNHTNHPILLSDRPSSCTNDLLRASTQCPSDQPRQRRLRQTQAKGGTPLRTRVRKSDLMKLKEIRSFCEEAFKVKPSNSVIIRRAIQAYLRVLGLTDFRAYQHERQVLLGVISDD